MPIFYAKCMNGNHYFYPYTNFAVQSCSHEMSLSKFPVKINRPVANNM